MTVKILDLTAGNRAIWFNKDHPLAVYLDRRPEVNPTITCDTTALPEAVGSSGYDLVVYDPPHMNCGPNSNMSKVYGYHTTFQILEDIAGFREGSRPRVQAECAYGPQVEHARHSLGARIQAAGRLGTSIWASDEGRPQVANVLGDAEEIR